MVGPVCGVALLFGLGAGVDRDARFIDLAGDSARQVVVDREEGQYLGHVSSVMLDDGAILVAYPKGHGRGPIVLKTSRDGGKTWSGRREPGRGLPKDWSESKETPTLFRSIDPKTGAKRLVLFSGLYPGMLASSEDEGETWTPLAPIGDWGGIVMMGSVERLNDGRYLAVWHDDGRFLRSGGTRTETMTLLSSMSGDAGRTWSEPRSFYSSDKLHLCEPGLVRSPDGRQMAILLRENRRLKNSHVMFSDDEGATWSDPRELPGALTGDRHTGKYAPDGRLLISFRDMAPESPTRGDWVAWVGRYEDIVNGAPGQYRVRLMDNTNAWDCAYPGVEVMPDGTFVCVTYGHWKQGEEPYIVCVRLTLAELDALAE